MFKKIMIVMMLLVCVPFIFADTTYSESGYSNGYFSSNTVGFFNTQLDFDIDEDGFPRSLSSGKFMPLVNDLDNDGENEIIVLDGSTIRIYHDKELNLNTTYSIPANSGVYSNMLTFDIDGDSNKEIIIYDETNKRMFFLTYDSVTSDVTIDYDFTVVDGALKSHSIIKCGTQEECMLVTGIGSANTGLYISSFNLTGISVTPKVLNPSSAFHFNCFSTIPNIPYLDYDRDGIYEYFLGWIDHHTGNVETINIRGFSFNMTTPNNEDDDGDFQNPVITVGEISNTDCLSAGGNEITNTLIFDADTGGDDEIIIGFMNKIDEFEMRSFNSDGVQLDTYPEIFDADGVIVSNIMRTNVFDDTDDDDFCVMGFNKDNEVDLLCASMLTGDTPQTREFIYDITSLWNVSIVDYDNYEVLTHAVQHSTEITNGENLNEYLTTYGVFAVDWDTNCRIQIGANIKCLDLIWANPVEDSAIIPIDLTGIGREDFIALDTGNVWYLDDDYSLSGAVISEYTVNPCIDSTWKISNASSDNITRNAEVRIIPIDVDNNNVMAEATLFADSIHNQSSGWSVLSSSGSTFVFSFDINATVSNSILRLRANDTSNPSEIDVIDLTISTSINGVEFGDCITSVDVDVEEELTEEEIAEQEFQENNSITNSIDDVLGAVNLNLPKNVVWLIIMLVVGSILTYAGYIKQDSNPKTVLTTVSIVEVILFLLGVALGYMSIIYLWLMIIIALGILSFKIRESVVGS